MKNIPQWRQNLLAAALSLGMSWGVVLAAAAEELPAAPPAVIDTTAALAEQHLEACCAPVLRRGVAVVSVRGNSFNLPLLLTLPMAQRLASENSPSLEAAAQRLAAAAAAVGQARAAYWPALGVESSARHADDVSRLQGGGGSMDIYAVKGIASWTVFDGFRREAELALAKAGREGATAGLADAARLLQNAVAAAFYGVAFAEEQLRIAQRDLDFNLELAVLSGRRLQAGAASRAELLNFEMRANIAREAAVAAGLDRDQAQIALAALLGIMPAVLPAALELELSAPADSAAGWEYERELANALERRPDLAAARADEAAVRAELRQASSGYWPDLALVAEAGFERADNWRFREDDRASSVGLAFSWNLFNGGQTAAARTAARARLQAAGERRRQLELEIAAEVGTLVSALKVASRQLELAGEIRDQAAELRDLVRRQYEAGSETVTRLNEAQTELVRRDALAALAEIRLRQLHEELAAATAAVPVE